MCGLVQARWGPKRCARRARGLPKWKSRIISRSGSGKYGKLEDAVMTTASRNFSRMWRVQRREEKRPKVETRNRRYILKSWFLPVICHWRARTVWILAINSTTVEKSEERFPSEPVTRARYLPFLPYFQKQGDAFVSAATENGLHPIYEALQRDSADKIIKKGKGEGDSRALFSYF